MALLTLALLTLALLTLALLALALLTLALLALALLLLALTLLLALLRSLILLHATLHRVQQAFRIGRRIQTCSQRILLLIACCGIRLAELLRDFAQVVRRFSLPLNSVIVASIFCISRRDFHAKWNLIVHQFIRCCPGRTGRFRVLCISACRLKIANRVVHLILQCLLTLRQRLTLLFLLLGIWILSNLLCFLDDLVLLVLSILQLLLHLRQTGPRRISTGLASRLTERSLGILNCIGRLLCRLLLLLRRSVARLLHILNGLIQLLGRFRDFRILCIPG